MSGLKTFGPDTLGERQEFSHEEAHLSNVSLPNPQADAKVDAGVGMSPGTRKGEEHQVLGTGQSFSNVKIDHNPGKGPGTAQGLTAGSAKGLAQPFGSADTKKR
jgi:hypothetical protein